MQKCVLRDEASGERKELSSAIKESSEIGCLFATEMCKLVSDTQRSIVEETTRSDDEDVKILRENRKTEFQNKEIEMRESMNRSQGSIITRIRRNRKEIIQKHRSRLSDLRIKYTKETERAQVLFDESTYCSVVLFEWIFREKYHLTPITVVSPHSYHSKIPTLENTGTAKKYAAMAQKSIEALLDWTKRRESRVASSDERRVHEVMTTSFDLVLETMRTELKELESQCRADVKIMYDTQITRVEKVESEIVRCRFMEDAVSLYKYLDATKAEAEKHESVQVASMSKHAETLLCVLTEFLSKSIRSEAHVTEQSELGRIRSVRLKW